jgi:hypothetical protein
MKQLTYSNYCVHESASLSVSDRYVVIKKLLEPIFNFRYSYAGGKFGHGTFLL